MRRPQSTYRNYPARRASVGSTLIPGLTTTVGDRARILEQLHTDFAQLQGDIFTAAGWRTDHPEVDESSPAWLWWQSQARHTLDEWQKFYANQASSWWAKFSTDWDVYTSWQERLVALREATKAELARAGRRLTSPDPVGIPRTPWDRARDLTGDVRDTLKTVGWVAAGVGGLLVVRALIQRSGSQ